MYSGNPYVDRIVNYGYYDYEEWEPESFRGDEANNEDVYDYCTELHDSYKYSDSDACDNCVFADDGKCTFETKPVDWDDEYFD